MGLTCALSLSHSSEKINNFFSFFRRCKNLALGMFWDKRRLLDDHQTQRKWPADFTREALQTSLALCRQCPWADFFSLSHSWGPLLRSENCTLARVKSCPAPSCPSEVSANKLRERQKVYAGAGWMIG